MPYFTWKEQGLTAECASLDAMASRFEEAAQLMRRMASEGFRVERIEGMQRITHDDEALFGAYGFISEESPVQRWTWSWKTAAQPPNGARNQRSKSP